MEKSDVHHDEKSDSSQIDDAQHEAPEITLEGGGFVDDKQRAKRLVRRIDLHLLPLCAWIYLLNYLDRGSIGNR